VDSNVKTIPRKGVNIMGDLTKNLSRKECACQCGCGLDTADFELVKVIQETCDHFAELLKIDKVFLQINSWSRCAKHNKSVGGVPMSLHTLGKAADIRIKDVPDKVLYDYLVTKYSNKYEIGLYIGRVHVGVTPRCHHYYVNK